MNLPWCPRRLDGPHELGDPRLVERRRRGGCGGRLDDQAEFEELPQRNLRKGDHRHERVADVRRFGVTNADAAAGPLLGGDQAVGLEQAQCLAHGSAAQPGPGDQLRLGGQLPAGRERPSDDVAAYARGEQFGRLGRGVKRAPPLRARGPVSGRIITLYLWLKTLLQTPASKSVAVRAITYKYYTSLLWPLSRIPTEPLPGRTP